MTANVATITGCRVTVRASQAKSPLDAGWFIPTGSPILVVSSLVPTAPPSAGTRVVAATTMMTM